KFRKKDVAPQIFIKVHSNETHWIFEVKDNGIGIDPKYHHKIFNIFERLHTRDEYQGSGIGLSHCARVAALHQGKIWIESSLGAGSTFIFSIAHEQIAE
ncbi:MAG: hypothetical protein RLY16_2066, partial [Bacteroidota bacterium]